MCIGKTCPNKTQKNDFKIETCCCVWRKSPSTDWFEIIRFLRFTQKSVHYFLSRTSILSITIFVPLFVFIIIVVHMQMNSSIIFNQSYSFDFYPWCFLYHFHFPLVVSLVANFESALMCQNWPFFNSVNGWLISVNKWIRLFKFHLLKAVAS